MFYIQYSVEKAFICLLFFLTMLVIARPYCTYRCPQGNNVRRGVFFFFLLYTLNSVFAFWSEDTYHSWEGFVAAKQYTSFEILGYEQVYNWLAAISGNNYFLWRALIWIPACLFLFISAKKLDLLNRNFLLSMILFAGLQAYTRGMLGHTMLLLGAILLVDDRNNRWERFVGLLLFCASYFFHKSMYVNIAFALLAFYPLGKKSIIASFIAFPFLTVIATMLVDSIASGALDVSLGEGVGGAGDRTVMYASDEKMILNANGKIGEFIELLPQYLVLFYLINRVVFKRYFAGINGERIFTYLFRLSFVAIYVASLFYFVETSSWIYSRFKYMVFFPLPFVLAKVWTLESKSDVWVKSVIGFQMFYLCFYWAYKFYSW